jgi:hypothetical protein
VHLDCGQKCGSGTLDCGQKCGSGTEYKLWDAGGNLLPKFRLDRSSLDNDNFDWGL